MYYRKELKNIKHTFDKAAEGYDRPALRFFTRSAEKLSDLINFYGNENIIDIATGTGAIAVNLAEKLPDGHVTGIDLSEQMIKKAQDKAEKKHLNNVTFHCVDLYSIEFTPDCFDGACCGFGILLLPDPAKGLEKVVRIVKPGGFFITSSFTETTFEPLISESFKLLEEYGISISFSQRKGLSKSDEYFVLFKNAGFQRLKAQKKQIGYYLNDSNDWWDILWYSGFRGLLKQLSTKELSDYRKKHLNEIFSGNRKVWLNFEVLYVWGYKSN